MDISHFLIRFTGSTVRALSADGLLAAQRQLHLCGQDQIWRNEEVQKYHFLQLSSSMPVFGIPRFLGQ